MKKAFDANVSRAKPRLRLGALMASENDASTVATMVESLAQQVAFEPMEAATADSGELGLALKARAQARSSRVSATEALQEAIAAPAVQAPQARAEESWAPAPEAPPFSAPPASLIQSPEAPRAHMEVPPLVTEVQTAPPPETEPAPAERRERLRQRLKAVRENPRPEPLPDTVAEAGVLAVERISLLQTELAKARAMNLALAQDLEAARRQAERATEEARLRTDEAKRLSTEMEGRVTLLSELERELESLEAERNEALLALQGSRQSLELREREKAELLEKLAQKDEEISDSIAEEERLAAELEQAQETMDSLRRGSAALKGERDTLARQVSDLTSERAELLEARKALEAVHRALSTAAMR